MFWVLFLRRVERVIKNVPRGTFLMGGGEVLSGFFKYHKQGLAVLA